MTERDSKVFSDREREEFIIRVEDYDYDYGWGIGETTFINQHSLTIRGRWRPLWTDENGVVSLRIGPGMWACIHIDQTDNDPKTRDDSLFHAVVGDRPNEH